MHTDTQESSHETSRTRWSVVRAAHEGNEAERLSALEYLFRRYAPALRTFVARRFQLSDAESEDLVQDFVLDRVLHKSLLAKARADRGRFRHFLLRSISRYSIDYLRAQSAQKRRLLHSAVSLDQLLEDGFERAAVEEETLFNDAFTRQIVGEAIRRTQRHCLNLSREDLWTIFEGRLLGPLLEDVPPISYDALCEELGLGSVAEAQNLLVSVKRIFKRQFHSIVQEYADSPQDVTEELSLLRSFLK